MSTFPSELIQELKLKFATPQNIVIITHHNPDGDALGSSLALKLVLEKENHTVKCIMPSTFPTYYNWMPDVASCIINSEKNKSDIELWMNSYDFIFCLDFNNTSRVYSLAEALAKTKVPKILIDHHEDTSDEFQYVFSYPGRSSTCELMYEFIEKLYSTDHIDIDVATCIYTGLITDTGGFQFSSTHESSHNIAASLIKKGISPSEIYNNCFNNFSLNRLKLFGYCIANNLKIYEKERLAIIWIDKSTKDKFSIQDGDTEGLVNYPLKVDDIDVSILFKQDYDKVKISFRSKNDVDVSQFAKHYFHGGGHKNASGGMSKLHLQDTIKYFESIISKLIETT